MFQPENLDLQVFVQFPKFIQALPHSLVDRTGDALLENVVKQIRNLRRAETVPEQLAPH